MMHGRSPLAGELVDFGGNEREIEKLAGVKGVEGATLCA